MFTAEELAEHQADAESLMADTFTAYSPSKQKVGGLNEKTMATEYATPGRVIGVTRDGATDTRMVTIGGVERPVLNGGLDIPIRMAVPKPGWEYVCTAVGPGRDPALVGRRWRVVDVDVQSYATARHLEVVEVTP